MRIIYVWFFSLCWAALLVIRFPEVMFAESANWMYSTPVQSPLLLVWNRYNFSYPCTMLKWQGCYENLQTLLSLWIWSPAQSHSDASNHIMQLSGSFSKYLFSTKMSVNSLWINLFKICIQHSFNLQKQMHCQFLEFMRMVQLLIVKKNGAGIELISRYEMT